MKKVVHDSLTTAIHDSLEALRTAFRDETENTSLLLPKECSKKWIMGTTQVNTDTTFTLFSVPNSAYLVKIYINGVLVGDNETKDSQTPVLVVDTSNASEPKVTYRSAQNEGYKLEAGDKVFIYWFH